MAGNVKHIINPTHNPVVAVFILPCVITGSGIMMSPLPGCIPTKPGSVVCLIPFGFPVDPLVYKIKSGDSESIGTGAKSPDSFAIMSK